MAGFFCAFFLSSLFSPFFLTSVSVVKPCLSPTSSCFPLFPIHLPIPIALPSSHMHPFCPLLSHLHFSFSFSIFSIWGLPPLPPNPTPETIPVPSTPCCFASPKFPKFPNFSHFI